MNRPRWVLGRTHRDSSKPPRARAAELLGPEIRGRGFGLVGLVEGIGDLVSSVVLGILFTVTSPAWEFIYAAALALAGDIGLMPGRKSRSTALWLDLPAGLAASDG